MDIERVKKAVIKRNGEWATFRLRAIMWNGCPKCGAERAVPCQGRNGDRKSVHQERIDLIKHVSR